MVWGIIGYNFKGPLVRLQVGRGKGKGMNFEKYCILLQHFLVRFIASIALQAGYVPDSVEDNCAFHGSRVTNQCRTALYIRRHPHPPQSPDLNPIEYCWLWIKQRLAHSGRIFTNADALWQEIHTLWLAIPQEYINKHIDRLHEKRKFVLRNGGIQTPHYTG